MKVLLVNGSPNNNGCTNRALQEVAATLNAEGVETEFFWIGNKPIAGCIACRQCAQTGKCVFADTVNECSELAKGYDAFVFGAPVYFGSIAGSMNAFLDRLFYPNRGTSSATFFGKPVAAVVSSRRAGSLASIDRLLRYFQLMEMPIISGSYWGEVHGNTPQEVEQDVEGMQVMRNLAHNMAWMLRLKEAGDKLGVEPAKRELPRTGMNFIR